MTPHLHATYVEGCYRCDLSKDEVQTIDLGYVHTRTERGDECREDCPHPAHNGSTHAGGGDA